LEPRVARPCCRQSSNSSLRFIASNSIHPLRAAARNHPPVGEARCPALSRIAALILVGERRASVGGEGRTHALVRWRRGASGRVWCGTGWLMGPGSWCETVACSGRRIGRKKMGEFETRKLWFENLDLRCLKKLVCTVLACFLCKYDIKNIYSATAPKSANFQQY
jgi:hypothetical protein